MKGKIYGFRADFFKGEHRSILTLVIDGIEALAKFEKLMDYEVDIEIKKHREKRSRNANSYYWEMVGRIADALNISKNEVHNRMLRRYGTDEEIDGSIVCQQIPDTEKAEKIVIEAETYHLRPTSKIVTGKNGVIYRYYIVIKGSSRYNSKEMSTLINGIISECNQLGIETPPSEEIAQLIKEMEAKNETHNG